jgi:hypothetical protein
VPPKTRETDHDVVPADQQLIMGCHRAFRQRSARGGQTNHSFVLLCCRADSERPIQAADRSLVGRLLMSPTRVRIPRVKNSTPVTIDKLIHSAAASNSQRGAAHQRSLSTRFSILHFQDT